MRMCATSRPDPRAEETPDRPAQTLVRSRSQLLSENNYTTEETEGFSCYSPTTEKMSVLVKCWYKESFTTFLRNFRRRVVWDRLMKMWRNVKENRFQANVTKKKWHLAESQMERISTTWRRNQWGRGLSWPPGQQSRRKPGRKETRSRFPNQKSHRREHEWK